MERVNFTAGRVAAFKCPEGKEQAFLWDSGVPGLALRVTTNGSRAYVFQSRYQGSTVRMTIGSPDAWRIGDAQEKARQLQRQIDEGRDPRAVKAETIAADVAKRKAVKGEALTVGEVWATYLADRKPRWGDIHYKDHVKLSKAGGEKAKRGTRGLGVTIAGPLHPLMTVRLRELDSPTIERWAATQTKTRPASARLSWRLLQVFLTWCSEQPEYAHLVPAKNPAKTQKTRETLGTSGVKKDALQREQLEAWFKSVREIGSPLISAYLQCLLLIGSRPGELLVLRWEDVNWQWKGMVIRDKVEGAREIPLTPYVASLLQSLPKRNEFVFSSAKAKSGVMSEPREMHDRACRAAGIPKMTQHGLRRSFKSLSEWMEIPAGVVAQIQGHKPSATAEKHYTVRPLDLLRVHHERIEAWILEQGAVPFVASETPVRLKVVS
ncbi:integrase family protein [Variovorax sp. LjRoot175]|uniref:tyrosine-type recombinase/integrase n=1 Tax=Variovorax sp. LjRoot175 TaxID=3342276 RepID=UPI003ECD1C20